MKSFIVMLASTVYSSHMHAINIKNREIKALSESDINNIVTYFYALKTCSNRL
ncbi:MAG: hypothetical protein ACI84K_001776 [Pseudohongiellaceae bacterium]|jgi:hypothetical protein